MENKNNKRRAKHLVTVIYFSVDILNLRSIEASNFGWWVGSVGEDSENKMETRS